MSGVSFFDDEADNSAVFEIDQDDIDGCSDIPTLVDWFHAMSGLKEDIQADVSARLATGKADEAWLWRVSRKMMFLGRGESRIRRRMKALGHDPVWESEQLVGLKRNLAFAKAEAAYGRHFIREAQELLSKDYFDEIGRRAMARMDKEKVAA